jgi:hypothetical protein
VAGAKVTITSVAESTSFEAITNESGNYSVTHLIPDTYRIKIEARGFKASDIPGVQVSADAAVHLDAQLQVGSVTETVEVTAEVPQLKTDQGGRQVRLRLRVVPRLREPILPEAGSSAQEVAAAAPYSKVVKAFNATSARGKISRVLTMTFGWG